MEREQEEETQDQESQSQTPPEETSTTQTPPTVNSPSISTDGRDLYQAVLRDKENRIRELEAKVNAPPPQQTKQLDESSYFTKPLESTRDLIQQELQTALAPLLGYVTGLQQVSAYDKLKQTFKQNPKLGPILTENESYVDQMMKSAEPTESNLMGAVLSAHGARVAGLLDSPTQQPTIQSTLAPTNQAPQNPISMNNPPHLRPSSPPAPRESTKAAPRQLSENERRLAREWNMSPEEYLKGQEEGSLVMEPDVTTNPSKKKKEEA